MHLHDAQRHSIPPPIRHSVYTLLTNLPFHYPGTDVAPWLLEEVPFLKVEKVGRLRVDRRGRRTVFV